MGNKKIILLGIIIFVVIGVVGVTVYLSSQQQDTRSGAQSISPSPEAQQTAQSCDTPEPPASVFIDYPNCPNGVNGECNFNEGVCEWEAVTGASSYDVTITQVDTNSQVLQQQVSSGTSLTFPVAQSATYRCSVTAKNSCGNSSTQASYEQFCEIEALVSSGTPTPTPTTTVSATPTPVLIVANSPVPTAAIPQETIAPTGSVAQTVGIIIGAISIIGVGLVLMAL